jgi:hypothetical protein
MQQYVGRAACLESAHLSTWRVAITCVLVSTLLSTAPAGIRAPGKYSGVVFYDRWGGCILFSGIYLMYISEDVKDTLRSYEGKAIEINAREVIQPINPGDGLIKELEVVGPATLNTANTQWTV